MALKINFVFDTESRHTKVSVQGVKSLWGDCSVFPRLGAQDTDSNQITVVAFQSVQLAQAWFLQKNQTLQNVFFYICNAEMAQSLSSLQKSEFLFG